MSAPDTPRHVTTLLYLLLLFASISTVRSDTDLQILLNIKSQLSNPPSLQSWQSNLPLCNFTGISCDPTGSVAEIDLTSQNLFGPLPLDSICTLPSLRKLAIGSNSLSGPIKPDLRNCAKLQYLDLASNHFSGPLPDFSNLIQLQVLNLSSNKFSGPLPSNSLRNLSNLISLLLGDNPTFDISPFPTEVLSLGKLSWLYLSNCSIEGEIPRSIGNLTGLINLELSCNHLTGVIPSEIVKLNNLWQLQLWRNNLVGKIPDGFRNLSKLEYFDVSDNKLEGDLRELKFLTNLISLQLFDNGFEGGIPAEFGNFKRLVNLSLYSNKLSGPLPPELGSWAEFNFIDVTDNILEGPIPPDMCKQGKMKKLLILNNRLSGEIPASYAACKTMIRFRVTNNSLSGRVPSGLWGLPNAEIIDLEFNSFDGPVTSDIASAGNLGQLFISNNKFSGGLPQEISKATSLVSIEASYNEFSGEIPSGIGELKKLNNLLLQGNAFSGDIPDSLASCDSLHVINFAGNSLSGQIPASLGSMQSLNSLNLSENRLVGQIPASFSSLKLSLLDLSENRLTGRIPDTLSIAAYNSSFIGNPGLCSQNIQNFRRCSSDYDKSSKLKTLISCFLAGASVLIVALGCYLFVKKGRRDRDRPIKESWDMKSFRIVSFTEQEILDSIKQDNLIGKGGSGNVYRVPLDNGKELAVKHIWNLDSGSSGRRSSSAMLMKRLEISPEFDAEVATLSSIRHVNVVKLYCSITSEDSNLLVYEYLPNGSLWDRLHTCQKMELDWGTRYEIAVGSAKGLEYLHHGCDRPIIHRDVKSSNILLDEFFKPRIADFGLAKIMQVSGAKDSTHVIAGTHGYIAPEYAYTCKVTEKSDVYSFGVVLMELVTGKRPIEPEFGNNKDIVYWVSSQMMSRESVIGLVDARIPEASKEDVIRVLRIAILCTARLPALRPTMRTVVQLLEDVEPCRYIAIGIKDEKKGGNDGFKTEKLNPSL
ncbi:receptor-like protein kinase 7 [Magnolia sinica]|uniref:receptor-like protein kinase 7 n=1 Tax=Magnolia sinica TaxID=86752 RepID=UPI002658F83D|nr:receptor-like protein kinase 7 [Magnolia sinica]